MVSKTKAGLANLRNRILAVPDRWIPIRRPRIDSFWNDFWSSENRIDQEPGAAVCRPSRVQSRFVGVSLTGDNA